MTFSIVAFDPDSRSWGIAVASKFLAVGAVVPWGRAGAGAVATQAAANLSYGPDGGRPRRARRGGRGERVGRAGRARLAGGRGRGRGGGRAAARRRRGAGQPASGSRRRGRAGC